MREIDSKINQILYGRLELEYGRNGDTNVRRLLGVVLPVALVLIYE